MNTTNLLIAFASVLAANGCASMEYPRAHLSPMSPGVTAVSFTSDLRAAYSIEKDGRQYLLVEPAPDAAFSYSAAESAGVSVGTSSGSESVSSSGKDLPLTGRAAYVVLARELQFRLAEAAINFGMTKEEYLEAYERLLRVVGSTAAVEAPHIDQQFSVVIGSMEQGGPDPPPQEAPDTDGAVAVSGPDLAAPPSDDQTDSAASPTPSAN